LSFPEAVEELAHQAGMEIPEGAELEPRGTDLRPLYDLLEEVAKLYRRQLRHHPQAHRAVDYLKGRGLTGEVAAAFGLGFAPPGWDFLLGTLGCSPATRERLVTAGLVIEQDGKRYDRFRDRIMFPIRDRRGRVIGFGGRVLGDGNPKYLNSPETPVFHKGRELYGLFEAQKANRRIERLLVVEGYMDVIALAQFGITYAVATLGTATTAETCNCSCVLPRSWCSASTVTAPGAMPPGRRSKPSCRWPRGASRWASCSCPKATTRILWFDA
jgi:DNA primase